MQYLYSICMAHQLLDKYDVHSWPLTTLYHFKFNPAMPELCWCKPEEDGRN